MKGTGATSWERFGPKVVEICRGAREHAGTAGGLCCAEVRSGCTTRGHAPGRARRRPRRSGFDRPPPPEDDLPDQQGHRREPEREHEHESHRRDPNTSRTIDSPIRPSV